MEVATGISIRNYKNMLRIPVSLNYTELRYIVHRIKIKGSADGRSWEKHLPFILLTLPTSNLLFVFVHCSVCTMGYKYQNPTLIKMQRLLIFDSKYVGTYWQLQQLVLSEKWKYCYPTHQYFRYKSLHSSRKINTSKLLEIWSVYCFWKFLNIKEYSFHSI